MKTDKVVFCEYTGCRKEIPEEKALYVQRTGKFFCSEGCRAGHHPQHETRGIIEVSPRQFVSFTTGGTS